MKDKIHPTVYKAKITCACGFEVEAFSTKGENVAQPFNIHFKCSDVCYFIKTPVGAFFKNLKCMLFPDPTAHTR